MRRFMNQSGYPDLAPGLFFDAEGVAGGTGGAEGGASGGSQGDGGSGGAGEKLFQKLGLTPEQQPVFNEYNKLHRKALKAERDEKERLLTELSKAKGLSEEQRTTYERQLAAIQREKDLEKSETERTYQERLKEQERAATEARQLLERERADRREADTANLLQGMARNFGAHDHESAAALMRRFASFEQALDPDTKQPIPGKMDLVFKYQVTEKGEGGQESRVEKRFNDAEAFSKAYFSDPRNDWMLDSKLKPGTGTRADGAPFRTATGSITTSELKRLQANPEEFAKRKAEITALVDAGRIVDDLSS